MIVYLKENYWVVEVVAKVDILSLTSKYMTFSYVLVYNKVAFALVNLQFKLRLNPQYIQYNSQYILNK